MHTKDDKELCEWLRENSAGIYRPAERAADRIEELLTIIEDRSSVPFSAGVSLPYTLDRLLLEARGIANVLADNARQDLNLNAADYWYDIEEQILKVYSDLQKAG